MEEPDEETSKRCQQDPNNWVWGLFYYNKLDPRIFPPKPITEMGFTVNFANPKSVFAFVTAIAFFGFIIFMIDRNT